MDRAPPNRQNHRPTSCAAQRLHRRLLILRNFLRFSRRLLNFETGLPFQLEPGPASASPVITGDKPFTVHLISVDSFDDLVVDFNASPIVWTGDMRGGGRGLFQGRPVLF